MLENMNVQYVGFEAKTLVREYSFVVRRGSNETSAFTLTIRNADFGPGGVRFQDAPDICSMRLHRELAVAGTLPVESHFSIGETELNDYRHAHAPKPSGNPYKPKQNDEE